MEKWIAPSLVLIDEIRNLYSCKASGISFIEDRDIEVLKDDNQFKFTFYSSIKEHSLIDQAKTSNLSQFYISSIEKSYVIPKGSLITSYRDCFDEIQGFSCSICSQCIYSESIEPESRYYFRYIIPVGESKVHFRDYDFYSFDYHVSGKKCWSSDLIKIHINDNEYHFYSIKEGNDSYLIIDSTVQCDFKETDKIAHSILVSYGFLSATIHLHEAYIIVSDEQSFINPIGIYYRGLRPTIKGQYTIFTTNAYSVLVPIAKNQDIANGEKKAIESIERNNWVNELVNFEERIFSNLVQLIYDNDAICRSAMMTIEASKFAIDIQLAVYCVAFETLSKQIMKIHDLKSPTVIDINIWNKKLKPKFQKTLTNIKERKRKIIDEKQLKFLNNKINCLNQPTNKDTLMQPFIKLGYVLSEDELECINFRNLSLHGSLPIKKGEDEIDKLFYVNLTLHKLCSILILKLAGFNGYIINNIKLHEQNIKRKVKQDGFLKI